jgi:hypothetical protein
VQQVLAAVRGDAPGNKQGLLGALAAQRLEDGVQEQVLDVDLGEVPGAEGLVVLPQPVGDLAHRRFGDQQLAGGVPEGVLDVAGRQAPGIHLGDQALQDVGVALQEAHQRRPVGLGAAADLRDPDIDRPLGRADVPGLIAIAQATPTLASSLVAAPAAENVSLFPFEQLLDHQARNGLDQRRDDIGLPVDAPSEQSLELLAHQHGRRYPPHGLSLLVVWLALHDIEAQAASIYRDRRTSPAGRDVSQRRTGDLRATGAIERRAEGVDLLAAAECRTVSQSARPEPWP